MKPWTFFAPECHRAMAFSNAILRCHGQLCFEKRDWCCGSGDGPHIAWYKCCIERWAAERVYKNGTRAVQGPQSSHWHQIDLPSQPERATGICYLGAKGPRPHRRAFWSSRLNILLVLLSWFNGMSLSMCPFNWVQQFDANLQAESSPSKIIASKGRASTLDTPKYSIAITRLA